MIEDTLIRSYIPSDLDEIKRIHEQNKLDFRFPDLDSPLFAVNKVLLSGGEVRASYALRMVAEGNLWIDKGDWTNAIGKWEAIKALDRAAMDAARDIGLDGVQVCLPPGYERFGKRLKSIGFTKGRPWDVYIKHCRER